MLLEFRIKNFKSFRDETVFSMTPAPKQKGLDYSVLQERAGGDLFRALSSAVIYGPNASGKTNIISAMEVFKAIILRGNIRNDENRDAPDAAKNSLELIPNVNGKQPEPVDFSIKFVESGLSFDYRLSLDIGTFLDEMYDRKILSESLHVNDRLVFDRNGELEFGDFEIISKFMIQKFAENKDNVVSLAQSNLNREELFLQNGFKSMFSSELVKRINDWFRKKFIVIYRSDLRQVTMQFENPQKRAAYVDRDFNDAVRIFGAANDMGYMTPDGETEPILYSIFKTDKNGAAVPAEIFESYGTIRFIKAILPLVAHALRTGATLVVDEFDASIHPMALMSVINVFHNDEINKRGAQLIFNTHNPIFLNSNLFRRDEIKFVERDEATQNSAHYSLSDFGTAGDKGVRKNENYMKNYFVNRYGAIKDIDFAPVFEKILEHAKQAENGRR